MDTTASESVQDDLSQRLREVIARQWGFASLRPLQERAMRAVLAGRDSLLVLPTGGGKSLCYQAPAVLRGEITVVISPLISLMKDQVDALRENGVPAVQLNSSLSPEEIREGENAILRNEVRLVFASPERMATSSFRRLLAQANVRTFAIDEAHCISHWGHDFRPEYRQLKHLKQLFPQASIHGFTATATERVRADIVAQLGLQNAEVLVGNFDRPNLTYRVVPRGNLMGQVFDCLDRHKGEAGIIYCIRRRDVDDLTMALKSRGINALPYHAGLTPEVRKETQTAFADEKCDVVVATVAFGMGIDRSNVRYVLHTGMPKTIEHYQQEAGRAGRDGLEAECVLLYSGSDAVTWKFLLEKSTGDSEQPVDPEYLQHAYRHIADMERYCLPITCRHRSLVEYFGQTYEAENCQACDLCLSDAEAHPDSQVIAKKILSCVARVKESFGVGHVISVLRGENIVAIREREHDKLTTYGLLREFSKSDLRDYVQQLIGLGVLERVGDDYPILKLNAASWDVMKDRQTVRLLYIPVLEKETAGKPSKRSKAETASWEGVDHELFEALRVLRREFAEQRGVAPYMILSDATLRELARVRPSSLEGLRMIYGIGEAKLRDYGEPFLGAVNQHCGVRTLSRDNPRSAPVSAPPEKGSSRPPSAAKLTAFEMFRRGESLDDVVAKTGRSRTTVADYLGEFIRTERPESIAVWVPDDIYQQVAAAARREGTERLKPIFVALEEKVPYDIIRAVVSHLPEVESMPIEDGEEKIENEG